MIVTFYVSFQTGLNCEEFFTATRGIPLGTSHVQVSNRLDRYAFTLIRHDLFAQVV